MVDIFALLDLFVKNFPWMIFDNLVATVFIDLGAQITAALLFDVLAPLMALFNSVF